MKTTDVTAWIISLDVMRKESIRDGYIDWMFLEVDSGVLGVLCYKVIQDDLDDVPLSVKETAASVPQGGLAWARNLSVLGMTNVSTWQRVVEVCRIFRGGELIKQRLVVTDLKAQADPDAKFLTIDEFVA